MSGDGSGGEGGSSRAATPPPRSAANEHSSSPSSPSTSEAGSRICDNRAGESKKVVAELIEAFKTALVAAEHVVVVVVDAPVVDVVCVDLEYKLLDGYILVRSERRVSGRGPCDDEEAAATAPARCVRLLAAAKAGGIALACAKAGGIRRRSGMMGIVSLLSGALLLLFCLLLLTTAPNDDDTIISGSKSPDSRVISLQSSSSSSLR